MRPFPHRCDEFCRCDICRKPLIYAPAVDEHACPDVTCEFGHGVHRALAAQEARRAERLRKVLLRLEEEAVAGLTTAAHEMTMSGGLPFCRCGVSLGSGDSAGDFITHALAVLRRAREKEDARRVNDPWSPADPDGLPPRSYPAWRRLEQARREGAIP